MLRSGAGGTLDAEDKEEVKLAISRYEALPTASLDCAVGSPRRHTAGGESSSSTTESESDLSSASCCWWRWGSQTVPLVPDTNKGDLTKMMPCPARQLTYVWNDGSSDSVRVRLVRRKRTLDLPPGCMLLTNEIIRVCGQQIEPVPAGMCVVVAVAMFAATDHCHLDHSAAATLSPQVSPQVSPQDLRVFRAPRPWSDCQPPAIRPPWRVWNTRWQAYVDLRMLGQPDLEQAWWRMWQGHDALNQAATLQHHGLASVWKEALRLPPRSSNSDNGGGAACRRLRELSDDDAGDASAPHNLTQLGNPTELQVDHHGFGSLGQTLFVSWSEA